MPGASIPGANDGTSSGVCPTIRGFFVTNLGYFIAAHATARDRAAAHCHKVPDGTVIVFKEPNRSLQQNAMLWACLSDIATQVEWPVDGAMQRLDAEDWKAILSAGLVKGQRVAQGVEGGFVMLGLRTSIMGKKEMSELIEFIRLFGDSKGVKWSAPE